MSIGDFLESLSQAILVGIMLVGKLGVTTMRVDDVCLPKRDAARVSTLNLRDLRELEIFTRAAPWLQTK